MNYLKAEFQRLKIELFDHELIEEPNKITLRRGEDYIRAIAPQNADILYFARKNGKNKTTADLEQALIWYTL